MFTQIDAHTETEKNRGISTERQEAEAKTKTGTETATEAETKPETDKAVERQEGRLQRASLRQTKNSKTDRPPLSHNLISSQKPTARGKTLL